ncbi:MAG: hypothetical protein ACK4WF_10180, partial [Candidatus Brocadiales bacterium]
MNSEIRNPKSEIKISVIGLGHVGLPTALGFAELGWEVIGADDDREKVDLIARGEAPFYEPGLQDLLRKHLSHSDVPSGPSKIRNPQSEIRNGSFPTGCFRLAPSVSEAIQEAQVLFVCVGTPQREDGSADLSQIEAVA